MSADTQAPRLLHAGKSPETNHSPSLKAVLGKSQGSGQGVCPLLSPQKPSCAFPSGRVWSCTPQASHPQSSRSWVQTIALGPCLPPSRCARFLAVPI